MISENIQGRALCIIAVRYYLTSEQFEKRITQIDQSFRRKFEIINVLSYDLEGAASSSGARAYPGQKVEGQWLDMSGFKMSISDQPDTDAYLYLNDTLFTKHPAAFFTSRLCSLSPLIASLDDAAIGGEIDPSTDVVFDELNQRVSMHASTYFFLLNKKANEILCDILNHLPDNDSYDYWINSQYRTYPRLKNILNICLNSPDNPWSWGGVGRLKSAELHKRKSVTIAVEHILSARIIMEGGYLVPINYGLNSKIMRWFNTGVNWLRSFFIR